MDILTRRGTTAFNIFHYLFTNHHNYFTLFLDTYYVQVICLKVIASYELYMNIMSDHVSTGKLFPSLLIQYPFISSIGLVIALIVIRYDVHNVIQLSLISEILL